MYIKCEHCNETIHNLMYRSHLIGSCIELKKNCEKCVEKRNILKEKEKSASEIRSFRQQRVR